MPRDADPARRSLIVAAESLFATQGIHGPTMAAIAKLAGQRNNSAVAYHFGGRQELVDAVLAKHQPEIEVTRRRMLDQLGHHQWSAVDLGRVLVEPLGAKLSDRDGGPAFLQIQAQLVSAGDPRVRSPIRPGNQRLSRHLAMLADGDKTRLEMVTTLVFHGLADYARREATATGGNRRRFVDALVRAVADLVAGTAIHGAGSTEVEAS